MLLWHSEYIKVVQLGTKMFQLSIVCLCVYQFSGKINDVTAITEELQ